MSGALRTLAKIPHKEFYGDASPMKDPPSVYSPQQTSGNEQNNNDVTTDRKYPAICETSDDRSDDIQLDLAGPHLVRAAEICMGEIEVQANIIRTLSVLSEQEKCCDMLADLAARLGILLGPNPNRNTNLLQEKGSEMQNKPLGMLSRIGYILGNIMAKSDAARVQVSRVFDELLETEA